MAVIQTGLPNSDDEPLARHHSSCHRNKNQISHVDTSESRIYTIQMSPISTSNTTNQSNTRNKNMSSSSPPGAATADGDANRRYEVTFEDWVQQQESDLHELQAALSSSRFNPCPNPGRCNDVIAAGVDHHHLEDLVRENVKHFEDYVERRNELMKEDVLALASPMWCSSLERSFFWNGGCRPTMQVRLFYVLAGHDFENRLNDYFRGVRRGDLHEISADQLQKIDDLHARTLVEEEKLTKRMASLEENVADIPIFPLTKNWRTVNGRDLGEALRPYREALTEIFQDAEKLRLKTMKEIVGILTPLQAVEYLAASKQMHLAIHEWGLKTDRDSRRA